MNDSEEAPHFHGSFATHYYIHPDQYFYKVPENVSDSPAASANCALSQVYFGIEKANLRYRETIVIQGAGGLELNAAAVAKECGAQVIVIDAVSSRLQKALLFGADYLINMNEHDTVEKRKNVIWEITNEKGADVAMKLTGVPAAVYDIAGVTGSESGGLGIALPILAPQYLAQGLGLDPGVMHRISLNASGGRS